MKDVIVVPKGKSPLKVLEEMGERVKNVWIFFDQSAVDNMHEDADRVSHRPGTKLYLIWNMSNEDVILKLDVEPLEYDEETEETVWTEAIKIESSNIAFKHKVADPDEILFFKMEE